MEFSTALVCTTVIHYLVSITLLLSGTFVRNTGFLSAGFRFYLCVLTWAVICYFCNGCPFTHLENEIALHYYGVPFYPEYNFDDSDVKELLSWKIFYYPLVAIILMLLVKYLTREHTRTT